MREFGISTNCCMGKSLGKVLELFSGHTNLVEIQCDAFHSLFHSADVCKEFEFRYTIHAPTGDGNLAEPFEPIRKASLKVIEETAKIGDSIGAEKLVIHPGFCLFPKIWDTSVAAMYRSLEELGQMQDEFSIRFVVENLGSWDCNHFKTPELVATLREFGLGFVLDVGHAHLTGTLAEFLQAKPDHFHLHDNFGVQDDHLACGAGEIDFNLVAKYFGDATLIVEVKSVEDAWESISYLEKIL